MVFVTEPCVGVPTLVNGDYVISELLLICEYLDEAYLGVLLRPDSGVRRAFSEPSVRKFLRLYLSFPSQHVAERFEEFMPCRSGPPHENNMTRAGVSKQI